MLPSKARGSIDTARSSYVDFGTGCSRSGCGRSSSGCRPWRRARRQGFEPPPADSGSGAAEDTAARRCLGRGTLGRRSRTSRGRGRCGPAARCGRRRRRRPRCSHGSRSCWHSHPECRPADRATRCIRASIDRATNLPRRGTSRTARVLRRSSVTNRTSWPSLLLPTLNVSVGEKRRTVDPVARECLAVREGCPQRRQFVWRRGDQVDLGAHGLVQCRV